MSGFKVISTDGRKKEDCNNTMDFIGKLLSIPVSDFVTHMFLIIHDHVKEFVGMRLEILSYICTPETQRHPTVWAHEDIFV